MRLFFDWDPRKAESNIAKHGVSFEEAMGVFLDPLALTIFDADGSDDEDRWVTLGEAGGAKLLLVIAVMVYSIDTVTSVDRPPKLKSAALR